MAEAAGPKPQGWAKMPSRQHEPGDWEGEAMIDFQRSGAGEHPHNITINQNTQAFCWEQRFTIFV